ncbi:hypothetical protein JWR97_06075, partial [Pseudomonas cedrina subsp. fulgida]|nr:hypothetical protein [Pseudomonas cedrina subsp. fulgida]
DLRCFEHFVRLADGHCGKPARHNSPFSEGRVEPSYVDTGKPTPTGVGAAVLTPARNGIFFDRAKVRSCVFYLVKGPA